MQVRQDGIRRSALDLLTLPDVSWPQIAAIWPELHGIHPEIVEQLEIDARYAGYLDRQDADILAFRRDEGLLLPDSLDYAAICGLSTECRVKLAAVRPRTLGQAARVDGITPAALTLVLAHVKAGARRNAARA
jgi:tRNA uridine 5-carboxymethylaminomethyl modification enzyme